MSSQVRQPVEGDRESAPPDVAESHGDAARVPGREVATQGRCRHCLVSMVDQMLADHEKSILANYRTERGMETPGLEHGARAG